MFTRRELNKETLIPCYVVVKTVADLPIFYKEEDCSRFLFQMYAANQGKPIPNIHRKDIISIANDLLLGLEPSLEPVIFQNSPLVNIISFSLVKNQAHFILSSNKKNGISKFISKLNLGFAKYFNAKHNRVGVLFNKPFKMFPLQGNREIDLVVSFVNIKKPLEVTQDLKNYSFSSFPDIFSSRKSRIIASESIMKNLGINKNKLDFYIDLLEK